MVSAYSVYFLLTKFYGRHSATINLYFDSLWSTYLLLIFGFFQYFTVSIIWHWTA